MKRNSTPQHLFFTSQSPRKMIVGRSKRAIERNNEYSNHISSKEFYEFNRNPCTSRLTDCGRNGICYRIFSIEQCSCKHGYTGNPYDERNGCAIPTTKIITLAGDFGMNISGVIGINDFQASYILSREFLESFFTLSFGSLYAKRSLIIPYFR